MVEKSADASVHHLLACRIVLDRLAEERLVLQDPDDPPVRPRGAAGGGVHQRPVRRGRCRGWFTPTAGTSGTFRRWFPWSIRRRSSGKRGRRPIGKRNRGKLSFLRSPASVFTSPSASSPSTPCPPRSRWPPSRTTGSPSLSTPANGGNGKRRLSLRERKSCGSSPRSDGREEQSTNKRRLRMGTKVHPFQKIASMLILGTIVALLSGW